MIIVASGPSAAGFIPPPDVPVIAVNGVIEWIERADYWFTLDPSEANIQRMKKRRPGTRYYAAVQKSCPLPFGVKRMLRTAGRNPDTRKPQTSLEWLYRWSGVTGICKHKGEIHTGNSAWGALQLAYELGARKAALIGVDATQDERIEGGRPNNLSHLPLLFESALDDMKVVNCGRMQSRLPRMRIDEAIAWLQ